MENKFIINKQSSDEYQIELISEYKDYHVIAKWDGCIDLRKSYNSSDATDPNNKDKKYIHICDIDEFIKVLFEIKEKAQSWFGDHDAWTDDPNYIKGFYIGDGT